VSSAFRRRLITTLLAAPAAIACVFLLSPDAFFAAVAILFLLAALEMLRISHVYARTAPKIGFLPALLVTLLVLFYALRQEPAGYEPGIALFAFLLFLLLGAALPVLFSAVEMRDGLVAIGITLFAVPSFALPPLALYLLQREDPWLLMVLLFLVWVGDTAAFFVGKRIGKRLLAPQVSPKKTWEGAGASFFAALLTAALWSWWRLDHVSLPLILLCGLTAILAQLGDLVESLVKRGAGVKDSSNALPGHGGFYDRLDALILAAPAFALGAWWIGFPELIP
jgi:phosphatidate cytidylyltransferase